MWRHRCGAEPRRAFTLIELLVTLAVVALLIGLLTPALGMARETAHRLSCASNQHSIGGAMAMFARDHRDRIPQSYFGRPDVGVPQEMMALTVGTIAPVTDRWEGLGCLSSGSGGYLDSDRCLYCASHAGSHSSERYEGKFKLGGARLYGNYHYHGDIDSVTGRVRLIDQPLNFVFVTDGLRTRSDFNHRHGANRLHGDLSVSWLTDQTDQVIDQLPAVEISPDLQVPLYSSLWKAIVAE